MLDLSVAAHLFRLSLENAFNRWQADQPPRGSYPHASDYLVPAGSFCQRRLLLNKEAQGNQPIRSNGSRLNAIYLNGWALHEKYQKLLARYGRVIEIETTHVDHERQIAFTPDAIVEHCGEQMLVEIKGYNADACSRLSERSAPPRAAMIQAQFYLHLLGLRYALILVENKNTQELLCWCVALDERLIQTQLERMACFQAASQAYTKTHQLPSRVCASAEDALARRCPNCEKCFADATPTPMD